MNRIYESTMQLLKIKAAFCFDLLFVILTADCN